MKSYTHPWKGFANKLRLVLHACEIFFLENCVLCYDRENKTGPEKKKISVPLPKEKTIPVMHLHHQSTRNQRPVDLIFFWKVYRSTAMSLKGKVDLICQDARHGAHCSEQPLTLPRQAPWFVRDLSAVRSRARSVSFLHPPRWIRRVGSPSCWPCCCYCFKPSTKHEPRALPPPWFLPSRRKRTQEFARRCRLLLPLFQEPRTPSENDFFFLTLWLI